MVFRHCLKPEAGGKKGQHGRIAQDGYQTFENKKFREDPEQGYGAYSRDQCALRRKNESGKTTTHTFIRSMFYGVRRLRGKAAQNDTYTKYEPWENPAEYMVGSCGLQVKEKNYRLTRNFL